MTTRWDLSVRYDRNQSNALPFKPNVHFRRRSSFEWTTVSNAALRSRKTSEVACCSWLRTQTRAVVVLCEVIWCTVCFVTAFSVSFDKNHRTKIRVSIMRTRNGNGYEKVFVTFQLGGNIEGYFAWWLRVSATFTQRKFLWKEFPSCLRNQKRAKRTCWTVLRFCHVYVTFTGIPRGTFVISKNRVYLRKCTNPKTSVQHQVPYATWTIYDYSDPKR